MKAHVKPLMGEDLSRDHTVDMMRVIAMFMVVFLHHMPSYFLKAGDVPGDFDAASHLLRYVGLGVFVFISGFLLGGRYNNLLSAQGVVSFLRKRLVRIFPLYWFALVIYIGMFFVYLGKPIGLANVVSHIAGVQLFYGEPIFTIWFVGLILTYYLLFALISLFTNKGHNFLILCTVIIAFLLAAKFVFVEIDNRVILYWPIFMFGVWRAQTNIRIGKHAFLASSGMAIVFGYIYLEFLKAPEALGISGDFVISLAVLNAFMCMSVFVLMSVLRSLRLMKIANYVRLVSYSSFCVYLFHTPFFQVAKKILGDSHSYGFRTVAFMGIIALLFGFSHMIQKANDGLIRRLHLV